MDNICISDIEALERLSLVLCLREDDNFLFRMLLKVLLNLLKFVFVIIHDNCFMADSLRNLVYLVSHKINHKRLFHVFQRELLDEVRYSCREDHRLHTFEVLLYLVNVLLETHIEHLVTLIQNIISNI